MTTRYPMNRSQWDNIYQILSDAHSEFLLEYARYQDGKNEEARREAGKKADRSMGMCRTLIGGNSEIKELFMTMAGKDDFGFDQYFEVRYFGHEMEGFLKTLREFINGLPE